MMTSMSMMVRTFAVFSMKLHWMLMVRNWTTKYNYCFEFDSSEILTVSDSFAVLVVGSGL